MTTTTALTTIQPNNTIRGWDPENLGQGFTLADMLAKSSMVPSALRGKPQDILVVMMTGRDLGLTPMQSLRGIHVIDGKGVLGADLMVAACKSRPSICRYFRLIESTVMRAEYETLRVGDSEPTKMAFTVEEATTAGLLNKDNWKKFRPAMLRARAASALCRAVYPDVVGGFYDPDEADGMARPAATQAPAAPSVHVVPAPEHVEATAVQVVDAPSEVLGETVAVGDAELANRFVQEITDAVAANDVVALKKVGMAIAQSKWATKDKTAQCPYAACVEMWKMQSAKLAKEKSSTSDTSTGAA